MLEKIPTKWKYITKRALTLFSLSLVGTFLAMLVFKQGAEVACSIMDAQFTALDGAESCQCQYGSGWVTSISIDHGFFDYEEIETDEILENK